MRIDLQRGFSSFLPLCGVYNVVISVVSWGQALPGQAEGLGMHGDRGSQLSVYFNVGDKPFPGACAETGGHS